MPMDLKQARFEMMGVKPAAEYLGIPEGTLRAWLSQGRLAYHKLGRRTLLKRADLEEFIERGRHPANPKAEDR